MTTIVQIECVSGKQTATLIFTSTLLGTWTWVCKEGAIVWGGSAKGTCPSALFQNQGPDTIYLSTTEYIYGAKGMVEGSTGKGERTDDSGGTFPAGDFSWECTKFE
jgi:hypothetical protein